MQEIEIWETTWNVFLAGVESENVNGGVVTCIFEPGNEEAICERLF